jgi:putative transposase
VVTETDKLAIDVPRDRQSSFDPQLIAKYQRRFPGFDDKIISMYARGMSTREIVGHLHDLYGIDVSPDLISTVTDAVLDEVVTWQQRPLDPIYPLVFFDALRVKIRDEGMVRNKAIHIALGVRADGAIEALNSKLRRAVRARGHFPSDDAATKLLYLILNRSEKEWKMPPREWSMATAQFAVIFGDRFIRAMAA